MNRYLIGVDIGGTNVRVAIAPINAFSIENIKKLKQTTVKDEPGSISKQVISMIKSLIEQENLEINIVESISIATAGPIDMDKGEVFNNANLGFKNIPLREPLASEFPGIPIHLINDCNGAVLGVHHFEATSEERSNLAYITISTGIGAGIIANGRLVLGKEGNAAEVGHGVVSPHSGVKCNCGGEGCWEAFSSGTAVEKHAIRLVKERSNNAIILLEQARGKMEDITSKEVYQAARKGDEIANQVVDEANYFNSIGIGLINNFFDISVAYLGGSMLKDADLIIPPLQEQFRNNPLQFTINNPPVIKKSQLGDEVGLLGALALGKYKIENNKVLG